MFKEKMTNCKFLFLLIVFYIVLII